MTTAQYHIEQEAHAKSVNEIVQTVKMNSFPENVKVQVIESGEKAIELINSLRKEVYKKTEDFALEPEKYDHEEEIHQKNIEVLTENQSITDLEHRLLEKASVLIFDTEKSVTERITGPDFVNFEKTRKHKKNENAIIQTLETMRNSIIKTKIKEDASEEKEPEAPESENKQEDQKL